MTARSLLAAAGGSVLAALLASAPAAAFTLQPAQEAGVAAEIEETHRSVFTYVDPAVAGIEGVVPWETFAALDYTFESPFPGATSVSRSYGEAIAALDGEEIKLAGFIYPLEGSGKQSHFLFSGFPPGCPFCLPAGPAQLVEVLCAEPVQYTDGPVVLTGRFELLHNDPSGLFYRLHDARAVDS
jgi:uncharacterized protein